MQLSFEEILGAFVALERRLDFKKLRMDGYPDRIDEKKIVKALAVHTGYDVKVLGADLYAEEVTKDVGRARDLYSKVIILDSGDKPAAEIVLNTHKLPDGSALVNYCWTRFCKVKEACQIYLRGYFRDHQWTYPDTASLAQIDTLFKNLVRFKFSIEDFDNKNYPQDTKVENAAEIIAILLLYPIEKMATDRLAMGGDLDMSAFSLYTHELADTYKVPERYVDLFLTSENFDKIHAKIIQLREGL